MPTCIDLSERFGKQYRVKYEESYYAQYGPRAITNDPWLKIIPCANGHIFPWGGTRLAASSNSMGPTAKTLRGLPFIEVWNDASDGVTILFDVADFEKVADVMKPRRKRRLSEEQRKICSQRGIENLRRYREAKVETPPEAEFCVPTA